MKKHLTLFKTILFVLLFSSVRLFGATNTCDLPVSVAVNDVNVCEGEDAVFEVSVDLPNTITTYYYQWSKDGSIVSDASLSSDFSIANVESTDGGTYCLKVFEGHPDTSSCYVEECAELMMGFHPQPYLFNTDTTTCEDSPLTLHASELASDLDEIMYQWMLYGDPIEGSTSLILDDVSYAGTYSLQASNDFCTQEVSILVDVRNLPSVDAGASIILDDFSESFVLSGDHTGEYAYWSSENLVFDDVTSLNPVVTAFSDGYYTATLTSVNGPCINSDSAEILIRDNPTGLDQIISLGDHNNLLIDMLGFNSVDLQVYDLRGKQLDRAQMLEGMDWFPENYKLGIYIYRLVYNDSNVKSGKFILVD